MTTEQAQQRLEEIRRLLEERERITKQAAVIDARMAELVGLKAEKRKRPILTDRELSRVVRT